MGHIKEVSSKSLVGLGQANKGGKKARGGAPSVASCYTNWRRVGDRGGRRRQFVSARPCSRMTGGGRGKRKEYDGKTRGLLLKWRRKEKTKPGHVIRGDDARGGEGGGR